MKVGKTLYALVDKNGKFVVWDYESPFVYESKKELMWQLNIIKEVRGEDLLKEGVVRKIKITLIT